MSEVDWWWPGALIGFAVFVVLVVLLTWWLMRSTKRSLERQWEVESDADDGNDTDPLP